MLADVPNAPYFAVVRTTTRMDVKRAAELAELPLDEFLALNPQHNRPVISGADEYAILLPIDKAEIFAAKLDLVDQPLVSWQAYRMKPARRCRRSRSATGCRSRRCASVNGIGPRADGARRATRCWCRSQRPTARGGRVAADAVFTTVPAGRTFFHTVAPRRHAAARSAARYGVTAQDLKRWNGLAQDGVRAGQKLRVTSDVSPVKSAGTARSRAKAKRDAKTAARASKAGGRPRRRDRPVSGSGRARRSGTRVSAQVATAEVRRVARAASVAAAATGVPLESKTGDA